jgi:hypothetical protein
MRVMIAKASAQAQLAGHCQTFGTDGDGVYYTGTELMRHTAQSMPNDFRTYMREMRIQYTHEKWHSEHTWDNRSGRAGNLVRWNCNNFRRFSRQMGDVGSGLDFLMMHHLMVQDVWRKFPEYADTLLAGWARVSTDPYDQENRLPGDARMPFDAQVLAKINRVQESLASFRSEDELGLFIWSELSKTPF